MSNNRMVNLVTVVLLTCLTIASGLRSATVGSSRHVAIYTAMQPGQNVLRYLEDAKAIAGNGNLSVANTIYFCCSSFGMNATGQFNPRYPGNITKYQEMVSPLKDAGVEVFFVLDADYKAIFEKKWDLQSLDNLARLFKEQLFGAGVIMDFEPGWRDYMPKLTPNQASSIYGEYLAHQALAFGKYGLKSTFDSADWGIIDIPTYPQLINTTEKGAKQQIITTMGTYGHQPSSRDFILNQTKTATAAGYTSNLLDFGVATTLTSDYNKKLPHRSRNWNWTSTSFHDFASFLSQNDLGRISFWRVDIDPNWPASATEPWLWKTASQFLHGQI